MSIYKIGAQKTKGGFKVVLFSEDNGKLVLSGESLKNLNDADDILSAIVHGWNDKRNTLAIKAEVFQASKKWPKNSGPKKKAVRKPKKR